MSEVKRLRLVDTHGYPALPVDDCIPGERWVSEDDFDRMTAERDALQQLLNQRDEQVETLKLQHQDEAAACAHEWTDDGEFTLTCTKCGKTENHEPYGWVQTRGNAINHFTQEWDVVESWEDHGFEYKAMFDHAEQPAPVAVVMPERKPDVNKSFEGTDAEWYGNIGWNACLDELKRLNPSL